MLRLRCSSFAKGLRIDAGMSNAVLILFKSRGLSFRPVVDNKGR